MTIVLYTCKYTFSLAIGEVQRSMLEFTPGVLISVRTHSLPHNRPLFGGHSVFFQVQLCNL